jgi:hypothetical protein
MSATVTDPSASEVATAKTDQVPKRITNAQTVCNEKNAKGKLCNGHLKQLRTAGEEAEIHLRGDDVLFKCQVCGTLYMGPPLGHVRDPNKQSRFVEAELTALLQAAGGTLPVIKKNERGVWVMLDSAAGHSAAKPAAPTPAAVKPPATTAAVQAPAAPKPATAAPPKPTPHKAGTEPNRKLFKRSTYAGVTDTGPVAGETFEQKVARLRAVAAGAKQRAEEGGGVVAPSAETPAAEPQAKVESPPPVAATPVQSVTAPAPAPSSTTHKPSGQADRTLMKRSTYAGVVDTGPVAGETFEQKVERLRAVAAGAKARSEGG